MLAGFTRYFAYKRVQALGQCGRLFPQVAAKAGTRAVLREAVQIQSPLPGVQPQSATGQGVDPRREPGRRAHLPHAVAHDRQIRRAALVDHPGDTGDQHADPAEEDKQAAGPTERPLSSRQAMLTATSATPTSESRDGKMDESRVEGI